MALLHQAIIDPNYAKTSLGVSTIDQTTIYPLTGIPLATNTVFALTTAIVDASGNQINTFGGTSSSFNAAFPATGTAIGVKNGSNMVALVEGQATMANSLPVTLASDQTSLSVKTNDVVDTNNSSTATLLANATFTGIGTDTLGYTSISVYVYSDQSSAANGVKIEFSSDNTNWNDATVDTFTSGNAAPNDGQTYLAVARARYMRVVYTNGAVNQTTFRLNTVLRVGSAFGDIIPVSDVPTSVADHAQIVKSAIMGKTTAGGGAWVDVKVNPSGALTTASTTQDAAGNSITSNSTTTTSTFGLDMNIRSILNTAPTTAGKLDVKGADGDVFIRQATAANLNATVVQGTASNLKAQVTGAGTAGTADTGVVTIQGIASMTKLLVTPDANSAVNVAQINGVTPLMGNGTTGTGSLRVTIASDNTQNSNPFLVEQSSTLAVTLQRVAITASSSGDNTLISAQGVGKVVYVYAFELSFSGTVNAKFTDGAGGTNLGGLYYGVVNAGAANSITPPYFLFKGTANTALILNLSGATACGGGISYFVI